MEFNFSCIRDVTFVVPPSAHDGEFSIELYWNIYCVRPRTASTYWDTRNGLHTDLKFQNQAIQCCLFEPPEAKYGKAVGRERAASIYATTRC